MKNESCIKTEFKNKKTIVQSIKFTVCLNFKKIAIFN